VREATRSSYHRILIVEDNWAFGESLRSLLEVAGHEIQVVADGEGALAKATSFRPDIVVCDIGLPGELDGNAVAAAIRRDAKYGAPHLIALSGYGQPTDKARALAAGFDHHVTKAEHPRVLMGLIADVPSRRGADGAPPAA
jgi:two-component system, sensor histidine kinase